MGELVYDRDEAARRAGVSVEALDQVVDLGIVTPGETQEFTSVDLRKIAMACNLASSGVSLTGLAEAISTGDLSLDFMELEAYDRFSSLIPLTFGELSEQCGVPVELLMVIREAAGSAQPKPEDRVREDEMELVPFLQFQVAEGFDPEAIERYLRLIGESLRRITVAESDWWLTEVINRRLGQGFASMDAVNPPYTSELLALMEGAMLSLYHSQQIQAWTRNILDGFEETLSQAGLHERLARPPAMCFLDITGYTRLTQERGDAAAATLAEDLSRLVQRAALTHGGRPVKWLGDGVMIWFREPGPGVVAALDMIDGVAASGLPPAHVGLHAGPVIAQNGDYYGSTVNMASRIADYARPGEVLVTDAVVEASDQSGAAFTEIGPVELKGVEGTVTLHSVHRAG